MTRFAKVILQIPHLTQEQEGDCLAVCAAMVFAYLGLDVSLQKLRAILGVMPGYGAPASNVLRLQSLGIHVEYRQGTLATIHRCLLRAQPVIAFVTTGQLQYWTYSTQHALLVVGMDDESVYLNDPHLTFGPIAVPIGEFDLAWLEQDEMYAVMTRQE